MTLVDQPAAPVEQAPNPPAPNPFHWRDIPSLVGVAGVACLAFAIARDTGFFWVLDRRLISLFSLEDVLRSALNIVPVFIIWSLIGVMIGALAPAAARALGQSNNPGRDVLFALAVSLIFYLFTPLWAAGWAWVAAFNIWFLWAWLIKRFSLGRSASLFVLGVLFLLLSVLQGAAEAQASLASDKYNYQLTLKGEAPIDVSLLRLTSDFLIVRANDSDIWVVPRTEVTMLKRLGLSKPEALMSVETPAKSVWQYLRDHWCEQCRL